MLKKRIRQVGGRVLKKALLLSGIVAICLVLITGKEREVMAQIRQVGNTVCNASLQDINANLPDLSLAKVGHVLMTPFRSLEEWWMRVEGTDASTVAGTKQRDTSDDVRFKDQFLQVDGVSLGRALSNGVCNIFIRGNNLLNDIAESTAVDMKAIVDELCEQMKEEDGVALIPEYFDEVGEQQRAEESGESSADDLLEEETELPFGGEGEMMEN